MKIMLKINVILILIMNVSCHQKDTINYLKITTGFTKLDETKLIDEYDNMENYKVCILKLDSVESFVRNNKTHLIDCNDIKGYLWDFYLKEHVSTILEPEFNLCYQGQNNKVQWHAVLNERTGEIVIEVFYTDFSGQSAD